MNTADESKTEAQHERAGQETHGDAQPQGLAQRFLWVLALAFIFPIVMTITNSFMDEIEIAANYKARSGKPLLLHGGFGAGVRHHQAHPGHGFPGPILHRAGGFHELPHDVWKLRAAHAAHHFGTDACGQHGGLRVRDAQVPRAQRAGSSYTSSRCSCHSR